MSSTRSPSPPAPATDPVLLLVAHGSSRGTSTAQTLERHAAALREAGPFTDVTIATLRGAPALEDVVAALPVGRDIVVLPMLMSEGALNQDELPRRLRAARQAAGAGAGGLAVLPPLGTSAALLALALHRATGAVEAAGGEAAAYGLLLIAHGNAGDARGRATVETAAAAARAAGTFADVRIAFLEEAPTVPETLSGCTTPMVAVGWFAAAGRHAADDVPRLLAAAPRGDQVLWLGALGEDETLPAVIVDHVRASRAADVASDRSRSAQS